MMDSDTSCLLSSQKEPPEPRLSRTLSPRSLCTLSGSHSLPPSHFLSLCSCHLDEGGNEARTQRAGKSSRVKSAFHDFSSDHEMFSPSLLWLLCVWAGCWLVFVTVSRRDEAILDSEVQCRAQSSSPVPKTRPGLQSGL